ncbi:hypothetical protein A7K94_0219780 [Modestobacter sp. VKM Ac-2676]|nr:hypothetical protein A7K94_0219780 [Modestobacter sp. VKM Ac-2676]
MGPGAAREHVPGRRALGALPVTAEAFAAGRLSYSKVRAITRGGRRRHGGGAGRAGAARHGLPGGARGACLAPVGRRRRGTGRGEAAFPGGTGTPTGMLVLHVRMDGESGAALLAGGWSLLRRDAS